MFLIIIFLYEVGGRSGRRVIMYSILRDKHGHLPSPSAITFYPHPTPTTHTPSSLLVFRYCYYWYQTGAERTICATGYLHPPVPTHPLIKLQYLISYDNHALPSNLHHLQKLVNTSHLFRPHPNKSGEGLLWSRYMS